MGLPLLMAGASILGGVLKLSAGKKRRKAARARRTIAKIQNFQAKRKFINDFITAQGTALAEGAASGADLGSSGVQGTLASQRTQATTGLFEQDRQSALSAYAGKKEDQASTLQGVASFVTNTASAIDTYHTEKPVKPPKVK
jgi:hypothetical protein